jgi:acetyl esterase/lipase
MKKNRYPIVSLLFSLLFVSHAKGNVSNTLDSQIAEFLTELSKQDVPPIYTLSPIKARKVLDDLQASSVNTIPASIQEKIIPGGPTKEVSVTIVRPKTAKGKLPAIIYMHGGGWILGNKNTHDRLIRELANGTQAALVFVNYTPSPEAHFPVAIEQGYAVLEYIAKHGNLLQLDQQQIAIVGDSVGGNMATVLTMMAKDRNGPKIKQQILFYPVTDANFNTGSYKQFTNGPWLTKKSMEWFWDAYLPNKNERKKSYASPLQATIEQLKGLPPALIIVDEHDVLRDEGQAYARKLMQAGVPTTAVVFLGTIHDFVMLYPLKNTPETRGAIDLAICTLKKVFGK